MTGVLIVGVVSRGNLDPISHELVAAGLGLIEGSHSKVFGLLVGADCAQATDAFASGAMSHLYVAAGERFAAYHGDQYLAAVLAAIEQCAPEVVLFPQAFEFADLAPRVAARLKAGIVTGCVAMSFEGNSLVATKSVGGGAALAEYVFKTECKVALVAGGSFAASESQGTCEVSALQVPDVASTVTVLKEIAPIDESGPNLKTARAVVAGGLGIGSKDNWGLIEDAAVALGAATAGTRAVVELGWIQQSRQVGFSGKKVSPDLYVAVGISGAIHHLAGIKGAKTIVAINTDADSGIFRVARFGVVGDAKEVLPAFVERVRELRQTAQKS